MSNFLPSQKQYKKLENTFFKVHLISALETAVGTTKESHFLECVEADTAELAVDGDFADCFRRGMNET